LFTFLDLIRVNNIRGPAMNDSNLERKLNDQLKVIYFYLLKMGASKEDAEDIIQETAYKFLKYIDSIKVDYLESWLFKVAVNHHYDLCRKYSRQKEIILTFNIEKLIEDFTPEKKLMQKEASTDVHFLLEKIKPQYRQLLLLKYSTNLKIKEISEILNIKEDSVKTLLYRARKQFIEKYRRLESEG
jgi:RNA polymerase sigma factor (sigma-70 family)